VVTTASTSQARLYDFLKGLSLEMVWVFLFTNRSDPGGPTKSPGFIFNYLGASPILNFRVLNMFLPVKMQTPVAYVGGSP
jgi:hypothetical protein